MLELSEKNFKAVIILRVSTISNSPEKKEKIGNVSKEPKVTKEPNGNTELKNTIRKIYFKYLAGWTQQ